MRLQTLLISTAAAALAGAAQAQTTPEQILAANRVATHREALAGKRTLELSYAYAGEGMTGVVGSTLDLATGAFVDTDAVGPVTGANGFDGQTAWMRDMSGAVTPEAGGDKRQLAVNEAYRNANAWWKPGFGGASVASLGVKTDGGRNFDVLSVTPAGGKAFEAWFDASDHLLARTVEPQAFQTISVFFSDYAPTDGFMIAAKQSIDDGTGEQYRQSQTLASARFLPARPAGAYAPPAWSVADAAIANPSGRTTVPFRLLNNHIYAEVRVNGKGPFLCIFDTGGHDIVTPETAKALTVKSEGQAPGTGAGEGVVNVGFAKDVTFQIGDLTMHDKAITVLPFEQGQVEGFDEQGMIGFEVFRRFVTVVDYGAHTLTFIDPAKFDPRGAGIPVPFRFYDHLPQVEGTFEGMSGRFDIDTGSRDELTLTKPFVDARGLIASHPKGVLATDGWGVGGPSRSYVTHSASLTLGPVRVSGLVAGLSVQNKGAMSDPNYIGNVGSGLLKRFVVTFDYAHQTMYLRPLPAPVTDTDDFDRSGMWINGAPGGFKIVDLTAKGPAEAAGLKVGDEITAVDGAAATSIALSDFRERLRAGAVGTRVRLTISNAGAPREVSVILKDQI
ncbi:MAG TPA: aspartyl protease family protein [Caulobacteraceae bacterium]